MGGPRTDFAYPRVIEAELRARGLPAEVRVTALPSARTQDEFKVWERDVVPWSPDVIILNVGHFETVHFILPAWLERYAHAKHRRPGRVRELYQMLIGKSWKTLAVVQQRADMRLNSTMRSRIPRRVAADTERLIERMRSIASPLVIVPDIIQPGPPYRNWLPGMGERIDVMNKAIDEVVERMDHPDIRRWRLTELIDGLNLEEPTPDGGHFTPYVHRAIGQGLAEVIFEWSQTQPHLMLTPHHSGATSLDEARAERARAVRARA
jgi:hypothetical protein